ncbi:class I SAM-dependent methyltransferase [Nocardioides salsibiostraticola]
MDLRMPWLPFRLIDDLESRVGLGTKVFEYGGGGSTLWFLDRGASVTTVEHHPAWRVRLADEIDDPRWNLLECTGTDLADYVNSIRTCAEGSLDVVVVDGRERVRCAHEALPYLKPGGWLIVDDVDRDKYAEGLSRIDWPRRDVVGFAPAKPSLAYSAVFVKSGSGA